MRLFLHINKSIINNIFYYYIGHDNAIKNNYYYAIYYAYLSRLLFIATEINERHVHKIRGHDDGNRFIAQWLLGPHTHDTSQFRVLNKIEGHKIIHQISLHILLHSTRVRINTHIHL